MKYQYEPAAPVSYRHEQREQHLDHRHNFDDFDHLEHLKQLEQMQLHPFNHQSNNFYNQQHYLTIEDIKSTRNSCWLCGCNWLEDHVSLDCPECGGYALSRPCPNCDGKCQQTWTRNISATHDRHKALWVGQCKFQSKQPIMSETDRFKAAAQAAAAIITSNKQLLLNGPYQTTGVTATTNSTPSANTNTHTTTTNTTANQLTAGQNMTSSGLMAPSSCCSSRPSSAATSDEEPDDLSPK